MGWIAFANFRGRIFQSRVASSLLKTSSLNELIVKSESEYVEKAVHIARNKAYLNELKKLIIGREKILCLTTYLLLKTLRKHILKY